MKKNTQILIAEDENIIAKDISKTLTRLGYSVAGTFRTGEDVIKNAAIFNPDLILMDIKLEGEMTGIQAAELIKKELDVPIVYLTAFADPATLQKAKITEPFGYILKPFDEKTLHSSIEMALYKYKMNTRLKERTQELEEERKKSNQLLLNILPAEIVKELREKGKVEPKEFKEVTLLFTDFEDFTSIAAGMHPSELVAELNDIFKNFDMIIDNYKLEKLKMIGDSYLVGGGLPTESEDHAVKVVSAALEMQHYLEKRNEVSAHHWKMRAGVHSGNVIAGIIGRQKFAYDVWGETVNIASKMERMGVPGKVNISEGTYNLVKNYFNCYCNRVNGLLNGESIKMYFISEKKASQI